MWETKKVLELLKMEDKRNFVICVFLLKTDFKLSLSITFTFFDFCKSKFSSFSKFLEYLFIKVSLILFFKIM